MSDEQIKQIKLLIERYGHDAVLDITEAVLAHAIEFRMQVSRTSMSVPSIFVSTTKA